MSESKLSAKWMSVDQPKDEQGRADRRILIENSYATLLLLQKIIDNEVEMLLRQQVEAFDKPNFAENQARILGSLKTLRELRTLTPQIRKD